MRKPRIGEATVGLEAPPRPSARTPRARTSRRFLNRELSWIDFDRRVLALAADPTVPLLDRVRFCAIASSNLDEFFAVRIAELHDQTATGLTRTSPDGAHAGADAPGRPRCDRRPPGSAGRAVAERAPAGARRRPDPCLHASGLPSRRAQVAEEAIRARRPPAPDADRARACFAVLAPAVARVVRGRRHRRQRRLAARLRERPPRLSRASSKSGAGESTSRSRTRSCTSCRSSSATRSGRRRCSG